MNGRKTARAGGWRAGCTWRVLTMACAVTLLGMNGGAARAEVKPADPVDTGMRACLARADRSSTAGQVQCMEDARAAWRGAADSAFAQLVAALPPAQQRRWRTSQQRWAAWLDAEDPLLGAVFSTTHGTVYATYAADVRLQPVRDRALALRDEVASATSGRRAPRARACSADTTCTRMTRDLERYYRQLDRKLPAHARPALVRAQRAWRAYRDATLPLIDERARLDMLSARLATLKRLAGTVGAGG